MQINLTPEQAARFWTHVQKSDGCWLWLAAKNPNGYGHLGIDGKTYLAHRVAFTLVRGPIPEGNCLCHNCPSGDRPDCVNPWHMFTGTHADNMRDATLKGQTASGDRSGMRKHPERHASRIGASIFQRGEEHWTHRLPERVARGTAMSDALLIDIRTAHVPGKVGYDVLAKQFGISKAQVARVIRGEIVGTSPKST